MKWFRWTRLALSISVKEFLNDIAATAKYISFIKSNIVYPFPIKMCGISISWGHKKVERKQDNKKPKRTTTSIQWLS